jgi:protein TonB
MRSALTISVSIHALVSLIAFNWVSFREVKYIPRQVYNVTLVPEPVRAEPVKVQKSDPSPPAEPAEQLEPEEKEEELPPPVEKPKPKPPPPKPKPKPRPEVPKVEETRPDSTALAADAAESSPQTGEMALDTDDFPFAPYVNRVRRKIASNWRVPEGSQGEDRFCRVYFRIQRDGSVTDVAVEESSGLFMFDQGAQRSVLESAPLPPLPREYRDPYLGVHFSFAYKESR